ncbi:PAS domain S-box protein [uncultured Nostoc sp.]|uniref:PAS domain S-box protein n=1 Tax=uncultured Nostoc sp. TaxID=340711 RepID=UPI002622DE6E|nr:PAS domain S-box protein [uncultured Nostoc sp.]
MTHKVRTFKPKDIFAGGRNKGAIIPEQLLHYTIALLSVALGLGVTMLLRPYLSATPSALFFAAVMVSAWYGGFAPGLFATVLSTLVVNYLFLQPLYPLYITHRDILVRLAVFMMTAGLIVWLNESRRTAQRKAEASLKSLRQSEARFGRLVESNIIGVIVTDVNGSIIEANDAFLQMLNYTREDLRSGRIRLGEITPPQYLEVSEQSIQELRITGGCKPFEQEYIRKDGSLILALLGFVKQEETIIGFVLDWSERQAALRDRNQVEAALRESEARFRHLADTAPVLVWMSGTDKLYYYFNKPWLEFTGRTLEQEMGNGWAEGVHEDDFQHCLDTHINAFDARQDFKMEYRFRRNDSEYRWILDTGVPRFTPTGEFLGYIGSCVDIHDRKVAEAALQQLNEMLEQRIQERTLQLEAANKELESFSYSVSHDLRAPLRHIAGFIELLQKRHSSTSTLDETSQRYLRIIAETAKLAGILIDELLTFSRMGRTEMRYINLNMEQLVQEIKRDLVSQTPGRTINWHIESVPEVQGDPSMLRLVLRNLIGNAVKYTQTRNPAEITIGSTENENEVVFFIEDNGVGFNMQYVHKLFGVFQRLHSDQQFEGTGVGLANVQRIIHRHNGQVWAEAVVDSGATFYFSLPKLQKLEGE